MTTRQAGVGQLVEYVGPLTAEIAIQKRDGYCLQIELYPSDVERLARWDGCDARRIPLIFSTLARSFRESEIVIWQPEIWGLATAGAEALGGMKAQVERANFPPRMHQLDGNFSSDFAGHAMWQLDRPCSLQAVLSSAVEGIDGDARTGRTGVRFGFVFVPNPRPGDAGLDSVLCRFRFPPPVFTGDELSSPYAGWLASNLFLGQKIVETTAVPLPRPARRRMEKQGRAIPSVITVALRRAHRSPARNEPSETHWGCSWLVRGHWRKQWYPRAQRHAPVFVDPYLKGPEDKPLRMPRETVYRAVR